jgi:hypothetical protein
MVKVIAVPEPLAAQSPRKLQTKLGSVWHV